MTNLKKNWELLLILLWTVFAIYLSLVRSFFCDELVRLTQSYHSLPDSLKLLFAEPSPFSPGENILNWLCRSLLSGWLPEELWTRLPGLGWGLLTLFALRDLGRRFQTPYLLPLGIFSVAMTSYTLLMRPYGSLVCAGVIGLQHILQPKENNSKGKEGRSNLATIIFYFTLLFTHIYGICFLGFAALLKKNWIKFFTATSYTVLLLFLWKEHAVLFAKTTTLLQFDGLDILRNIVGSLTNPHKVAPLFLVLISIGAVHFYRCHKLEAWRTFLLALVTVIGPLVATLKSGYFFVPRQVGAALGVSWLLTAFGLSYLNDRGLKLLSLVVFVFITIIPWSWSILLRNPPYPDQPFYQFKKLSLRQVDQSAHLTLFLDYWNSDTFKYYMEKSSGTKPVPSEVIIGNSKFLRLCYTESDCIDFLTSPTLPTKSPLPHLRVLFSDIAPPLAENLFPPNTAFIRTW